MKLLRSTDIGYSPLSARDRQIKDGSKFDCLFPKPDLKTTLLQRDGEVEDTVKKMQEIVVKYSWQVKDLCKRLKASSVRQSVKNVFDFVYDYIKYQVEDGEKLRTPAYSWYEGQVLKRQRPNDEKIGVDCDCMSIFCGSCFKEMKIPFAFRITGYASSPLGFCRGFQHVYTIAYDENGKEIICDPVYIAFDKEKEYAIQKTYAMSLNGTDIIMLSGIDDESHHEYFENSDGTVGELAGRKKRKERRAARKARKKARKEARKEKRAAKKAIKKARKSGDKEALKVAKERKKAAKKKLKANRGGIVRVARKVGKGIARFTVATTMQIPRTMFCLLLRLNFRGLASKLANNEKAREQMKKLWRKLGGKTKSWQKAVEKGKNKKPLFGSKKLKGFTELQLQQLGAVLSEWGVFEGSETLGDIFSEKELGNLGIAATTTTAAATASATPIIVKVVKMLAKLGVKVAETASEAKANGEEVEEVDEDVSIDAPTPEEEQEDSSEPEQVETETPSEENIIDVEYQEVDEQPAETEFQEEDIEAQAEDIPLDEETSEDIEAYEVEEVEGLGTLGAGLFKRLKNGVKKVVSKVKTKRAAKKAAKKANKKATDKAAKKAARKQARADKRANKKANKANRKSRKTAQTTTSAQQPVQQRSIKTGTRQVVQQFKDSDEGQQIINTAQDFALQKGSELVEKYAGGNQNTYAPETQEKTPQQNDGKNKDTKEKKSWFQEHKAVAIVGGLLLVGGLGIAAHKVFSKTKNEGNGKLQALELF